MRIHLSGGGRGIAGKLIFSAFGLFFVFMGLLFVRQSWNELQEVKNMQRWAGTPCTIVSSKTEDAGEDFRLLLSYTYTVDGKSYSAGRYGKKDHLTAESMVEIKAAEERWAEGSQHECHYNPDNPADAVLTLPTVKDARRVLGFSLIFPAFGLLFASLPWLSRGRTKIGKQPSGSSERSPKIPLIIFGLIFAGAGIALLKPILLTPLQKTRDAQNWEAVPAKVVSSKVKSHRNDDGTTYSVYIAYRYEMDGREYYGDQYTFMGGSSSGHDSKAAIVRQYPKGHEFNLFVNPADPAESVIKRDYSKSLLFGLIPLAFAIVGIAIIIHGVRQKPPKLDEQQSLEQVVQLRAASPHKKAAAISAFTAVWLGVVYFLAVSDAPLLFPIVFGLFGVAMLGASVHAILALGNPRPTVEITPGDVHPETNVAMRWRMDGRIDRIRSLTIMLQCLHITTETRRSGGKTRTSTVKTPLLKKELLQTDSQLEIAQGTLQFTVPTEHPASRPGKRDGIEWQIVLNGDIPKWPDMKCELPFTVYPNG